MKILLINPPYRRLIGIGSPYFPLGLGYLAAFLDKNGYEVKIYNGEVSRQQEGNRHKHKGGDFVYIMSAHEHFFENLEKDDFFVWREFRKSFNEFKPDLVGVSVRTPMLKSALKITKLVKELNKDCPVVWGGFHPTILSDEVMAIPEVDFLVYGEGEQTLLDLVEALEGKNDFSEIAGLYYKSKAGALMKNQQRKLIDNLDDLPLPARHLVFKDDFYGPGVHADLMGSRGCPFLCTYCSAHSIWGKKVRYRSISSILNELRIQHDEYQCKITRFLDDSFTLKREWTEDLCCALIDAKLDIKWGCLTRADLIDESLLKLMVKAGCYRIDVGVESGSPRILKLMKKNITLEDVLKVDRLFDKYSIDWTAFFITGFPYETKEDLGATADFMKKINPYRFVLSNFTPYPGTEDYDRAKELGVLPDKIDWGIFDHNSPYNFFMKNMERTEYQKFFQELSGWTSLRNTHRLRGKESYYLKHPISLFRKTWKFLEKRIKK